MSNTGTIAQTASTLYINGNYLAGGAPATLNNQAGGLYDLHGDGGINGGNGSVAGVNLINNAGTFRKSSGTGASTISGVTFNNTGTVEVDSGVLSFQNAAFTQTAGATVLKGGAIASSSPLNI